MIMTVNSLISDLRFLKASVEEFLVEENLIEKQKRERETTKDTHPERS